MASQLDSIASGDLVEAQCKAICQNIAVALQDSNLAYYKSRDWLEIFYKCYAVGVINIEHGMPNKPYTALLRDAIHGLKFEFGFFKTQPFVIEQALMNLDLANVAHL